jgi:rod shape determining protein RodA
MTSVLGPRVSPGLGVHSRSVVTSKWRYFDPILAVLAVGISAFGSLMIWTATRDGLLAEGLSPTFYVKKQIIFTVIGVVIMMAVATIDYRRFTSWSPVLYGGSLFILLAVYAVGHKSRGAQAWFQFGSYQLEPSELCKVTLIVSLAAFLAAFKGRLPLRAFIAVLVLFMIPFALIYKQPDLGTALVLLVVLLAMLTVGGVRPIHLGVVSLLGVLGIAAVLHFGILQKYQTARLTSFLETPDQVNPSFLASNSDTATEEYNGALSKMAVSSGGIEGKGIGKAPLTNTGEVPEQQTDFIFSAVGEQVGLVGSSLLLVLFILMVWRIWRAATLSRDLVGMYICVGVLSIVVFQVFENVGMAMGIMPIAGIPLPFMSYGGTSLISMFALLGLVLNVRMHRFN